MRSGIRAASVIAAAAFSAHACASFGGDGAGRPPSEDASVDASVPIAEDADAGTGFGTTNRFEIDASNGCGTAFSAVNSTLTLGEGREGRGCFVCSPTGDVPYGIEAAETITFPAPGIYELDAWVRLPADAGVSTNNIGFVIFWRDGAGNVTPRENHRYVTETWTRMNIQVEILPGTVSVTYLISSGTPSCFVLDDLLFRLVR
jgi:hypothetical protein